MDTPSPSPQKNKMSLTFDFRLVIVALLLVIAGMFALWRPWEAQGGDRTIAVTGESTVKAAPDEFAFYPTYEFESADKQSAIDAMAKKSTEVVDKLKSLGVPDSGIKTNADGYDFPVYKNDTTPTYSLRITATVNNKELAQKVQDYLVTTAPTGAVTPQATFSEAKRKEVESKARDEATKDARAKAEQSAKNLGFGLGAVKTVDDGAGFGRGIGAYDITTSDAQNARESQLVIQPGENELSYSVTVTYFVR
jgi:uncharacterized protein YggE